MESRRANAPSIFETTGSAKAENSNEVIDRSDLLRITLGEAAAGSVVELLGRILEHHDRRSHSRKGCVPHHGFCSREECQLADCQEHQEQREERDQELDVDRAALVTYRYYPSHGSHL